MKKQSLSMIGKSGLAAGIIGLVLAYAAQAGVPLNNLEGVGGVAFNPLAYPSGQNKAKDADFPLSKGQFGAWYVNLGDKDVEWTAFGVSDTLFDRLEVSYGYEYVGAGKNIDKHNIGAKLNLVTENAGDTAWVPAISVGSIWKQTSEVATNVDDSAFDFYAVATKLITQGPIPLLVSVGTLATKEKVTGVFGYDDDYALTGFANLDVIPLSFLALGIEYKQGAHFSDFKNASYFDLHAAWFANKNLTLVAAYVNAGDSESTSEVGLGDGLVLSAQYAF